MADEQSTIKGLTAANIEGGVAYSVPGPSSDYGWKLTANYPAILWTSADYQILEDCKSIEFDDIRVSIADNGQLTTHYTNDLGGAPVEVGDDVAIQQAEMPEALSFSPEGATRIDVRDHYKNPVGDDLVVSKAWASHGTVTILEDGILAYRPTNGGALRDEVTFVLHDGHWNTQVLKVRLENNEPITEAGTQIIPNQLDEIGGSVSLDIGAFLTDLMEESASISVTGLPPGLSYDSARMRIEGEIAEECIAGSMWLSLWKFARSSSVGLRRTSSRSRRYGAPVIGTNICQSPPNGRLLAGFRAWKVKSDGIVAISSRTSPRSRWTRSPSRISAPARRQSSMATGSRNTTPTSSRMAIDAASIRAMSASDRGSVRGNRRRSAGSMVKSRAFRAAFRAPRPRRVVPTASPLMPVQAFP